MSERASQQVLRDYLEWEVVLVQVFPFGCSLSPWMVDEWIFTKVMKAIITLVASSSAQRPGSRAVDGEIQ